CLLKLLYRLAHPAGQFRQFLCSEQNQNNQQDDNQVRPCQIHEAGEEAHSNSNIRPFSRLARDFRLPKGAFDRARTEPPCLPMAIPVRHRNLTRKCYYGRRLIHLCALSGKAVSASAWSISRWQFTRPRV